MPATVIELRRGYDQVTSSLDPSQSSRRRVALVTGAGSVNSAITAAQADAAFPATLTQDGLTFHRFSHETETQGYDVYRITFTYRPFEFPQVGDIEVEINTDGGTGNATLALAHVGDYAPAGITATNTQGVIGVTMRNGQVEVEGVEVEVPTFEFVFHATITTASFTQSYAATVAAVTKTYNNATWCGFAAGEVFFRGMSGRLKKGSTNSTLSYRFAAAPIVSAHTDVNGIALPNRKPWDVLTYSRYEVTDETTGQVISGVRDAHIDRVYATSTFTSLGLGSTWPI